MCWSIGCSACRIGSGAGGVNGSICAGVVSALTKGVLAMILWSVGVFGWMSYMDSGS
jgi:hypothetical protein